jgi:transposase
MAVVADLSARRAARPAAHAPTPGRPPRVSGGQLRTLERILARGPRRAGYTTGLWTLARVAKVIQRQFGIRYHPSHVWRLLTARGWRCQPLELSETEKLTLLRMLQRGPRRAGHCINNGLSVLCGGLSGPRAHQVTRWLEPAKEIC